MPELPTGTVTFLFTDIEGSTRLWEQYPEAMDQALARHNAILQQAVTAHDGHVFNTGGDAFCCAFASATDAVTAALAAQQSLHNGMPSQQRPRIVYRVRPGMQRRARPDLRLPDCG